MQTQRCFIAWRVFVYRERSLLTKLRQLQQVDNFPGVVPASHPLVLPEAMLDYALWAECSSGGRVHDGNRVMTAIVRGGCQERCVFLCVHTRRSW
jgi:hypothetical protein